MTRSSVRSVAASALASLAIVGLGASAMAAEAAHGFYLLGSKGALAGFTPPPGVFIQNDLYIYSGDAGANLQLPLGGQIVAGVEATSVLDALTTLVILPGDFLGGNLGAGLVLPFGYTEVKASIGRFAVEDDIFTFADPLATAFVGWHAGNFHWQAGALVNIPIGDYQEGEIANISVHRWGTDVYAAATWLDPATGIDLSGAIGVTFNGENPATDYKTGTEFHLEGAISKNFTPAISAGILGYYYDQITGDSGAGARLGDFEGRVAAIGGTVGYNFQVGPLPVSTRLKYFHEFDVENRLQGDAGFITVSMPLWVPHP